MTSRSIVLSTAALLLMTAAPPLQLGFSPTAVFAQEVTVESALADNPSRLDLPQLRERIKVLRDAIDSGAFKGADRKAAVEKIKAYRDVLNQLRDQRQAGGQDNRQAEQRSQQPAEGQRAQGQGNERKAEQQAQQAERQARQAEKQARQAERKRAEQAERQARQAEKQARQAERQQAEKQARQAERQQAEQAERQQAQRKAERQQAQQREQQAQPQAPANAGLTREMIEALRDNRPADSLDLAELRARIAALRSAIDSGALSGDQRRQAHSQIVADREVMLALRDGTKEAPAERPRQARRDDTPQQEVDRRAREIISDTRPADKLDLNELRERLADNRELLGTGKLTRNEVQQLREQLREDRQELRSRVASRQQQEEEKTAEKPASSAGSAINTKDVSLIIEQRIDSDRLTERELEDRIQVLSRALKAGNITVREAEVARLLIDQDRSELRSRLYANRDRRRARWRDDSHDDIFIEFQAGYRPPPVIYAAEAMPRDIQMQLVAPPLYQTQRAYSAREIATNPDVREAMPGIEIDTLNFDFGSAEVRPEEIDKLDEIGVAIERIVAERPDEVFLIEGHTDAVGSDAANDALSLQRALAVREALLDYYIIDPENLQTVGLGERYLRIRTPYPEEENRRVTVRRITPLLAGRG